MTFRSLLILSSASLLLACSGGDAETVEAVEDAPVATTEAVETAPIVETPEVVETNADRLAAILDAQPDEAKARYPYRNPAETLAFFDIEPGMAVGEALPGSGWYSKILLPYLGDEGRLVGVNYPMDLWPNFGFMTDERLETLRTWESDWPEDAAEWTDSGVEIDAYTFATLPDDASLDAFLFVRALHNLNRFEDGRFMTDALAAVHGALKPGGMVGVVQHEGPANSPDDWANGSNGYLRKADVIAAFEAAGFALVEESDINANPMDVPTTEDGVWRLPPTLGTSREDAELRAEMEAIGETNRMTLKFRKL
ncbi:MAG: hypothetical protein WBF53_06810 [Litorimonas sp.]